MVSHREAKLKRYPNERLTNPVLKLDVHQIAFPKKYPSTERVTAYHNPNSDLPPADLDGNTVNEAAVLIQD